MPMPMSMPMSMGMPMVMPMSMPMSMPMRREGRPPTLEETGGSRAGSEPSEVVVLLVCKEAALRARATVAAAAMREAGVVVTLAPEEKTLKWAFKHAHRLRVGHVVLFARREAELGQARVKRMRDGEQVDVNIEQLGSWFMAGRPQTEFTRDAPL